MCVVLQFFLTYRFVKNISPNFTTDNQRVSNGLGSLAQQHLLTSSVVVPLVAASQVTKL